MPEASVGAQLAPFEPAIATPASGEPPAVIVPLTVGVTAVLKWLLKVSHWMKCSREGGLKRCPGLEGVMVPSQLPGTRQPHQPLASVAGLQLWAPLEPEMATPASGEPLWKIWPPSWA